MVSPPGPRGGMVDTRDLKSLGLVGRAGSSPAVGTRCCVIFSLKQSILGLSFQKGNSKGVKKELFWVKNGWVQMREKGEYLGEQDEDTEIKNLPLYTERKADGIYRYRRRVPKNLVERVGKGYLYRNLGRTKKDVVGNWPEAHANVEAILNGAQVSAEKSAELIKRKDHRATILHLVEEEYGKEAAQRLEVGAVDENLEYALMALADRLEGLYPKKTLALLHGAVLPERSASFSDVLDQYTEFKTTGYEATDHRLKVRIAKCKADLEAAIGAFKVYQQPVQTITRQDANAYRDSLLPVMAPNSVARYKSTLNAALNWYIKETGIDWTSPFAGLLIKGAGSSKTDRHPLNDEQVEQLKEVFQDDLVTNALFVILRDTGARVAEVAGLRVTDCNIDEGYIQITPTAWRRLKNAPSERSVPLSPETVKILQSLITEKDREAPIFERYTRPRGMDLVSAMMMKRFRKIITDKKLTMHSLRHRMKDKLRNTGCPEAISMAILGHGTNTVAANYGSGYAIEVMREHMEKAWD